MPHFVIGYALRTVLLGDSTLLEDHSKYLHEPGGCTVFMCGADLLLEPW